MIGPLCLRYRYDIRSIGSGILFGRVFGPDLLILDPGQLVEMVDQLSPVFLGRS